MSNNHRGRNPFLSSLPENIQRELLSELENRSSTYAEIAADLTSRGYKVGVSSVHRLGMRIQEERAIGESLYRLSKGVRHDPDLRKKVADFGLVCLARDILLGEIREAIEHCESNEEDPASGASS